jgi:hypothetical protein
VFAGRWPIGADAQRGQSDGRGRFGDDAQLFPKGVLRTGNRRIVNQHDIVDVALRDRECQQPDPPGRQCVGGMLPVGASTGAPAARARVKVGAPVGSTPMTLTAPP